MANHLESITGSGPVLPVGSFARYFAFTVPDGHDLLQIITDYAKNNQLPAAYVVRCAQDQTRADLPHKSPQGVHGGRVAYLRSRRLPGPRTDQASTGVCVCVLACAGARGA